MVHEIILEESVNEQLKEVCLQYYREGKAKEPKDIFCLLIDLMDLEGIPMHYPYHHYIMPMVLLTACRTIQKDEEDVLKQDLDEAVNRGKNILAGFCGLYGNCGAAVGVGIFYSIFTGTTPYSAKSWSKCNRATGETLIKIAQIDGPRCCKRNCFISLTEGIHLIKKEFGLDIPHRDEVQCKYFEQNKECRRKACPFYKEEVSC